MKIVIYDPTKGQAYQGDVCILPLPKGIRITSDEVIDIAAIGKKPGDIVIAAGELTGHNHAFRYSLDGIPRFHDEALARSLAATPAPKKVGAAVLYRDQKAVDALVSKGILTTGELCIGLLRVEENAPAITHDEHDGISIPAGEYYIGAKREMSADQVRRVED